MVIADLNVRVFDQGSEQLDYVGAITSEFVCSTVTANYNIFWHPYLQVVSNLLAPRSCLVAAEEYTGEIYTTGAPHGSLDQRPMD